MKNGYPERLICQHSWPHTPRSDCSEIPKARVTLPYVRGLSEAVRRILTPLDVRTNFRPCNTLRTLLVRPKDPVADLNKTGVVYRIPCAACPMAYVGQTGRRLQQRMQEHKRAVVQCDTTSSALAEHAWGFHHPVDWSNITVLDSHLHLHQRLVLEAIQIRTQPNLMNREEGVLNQTYNSLFRLPEL